MTGGTLIEAHFPWSRSDMVPMALSTLVCGLASPAFDGVAQALWVVLAIGCGYAFLVVALNVTTVRLDDEAVTTRIGPLLVWPGRYVPRSELQRARLVPHAGRGREYDVVIEHLAPGQQRIRTTRLVSCGGGDAHARALELVSRLNATLRPAGVEDVAP